MKKILAMFLALTMLVSLAACGVNSDATSQPTQGDTIPSTQTTESQSPESQPTGTLSNDAAGQTVNYFLLGMTIGDKSTSMIAYPDENGNTYVEYVGAEKKIGTLPASALADIVTALQATTLATMKDVSEYADGTDYASLYVSFDDGNYLSADYSGKISKEFTAAYEQMDKFFQDLTAEMPVYIPQPVIIGELSGDALDAAQAILAGSGIDPLDSVTISDIFTDGELNSYAGLSSADGVSDGVIVSALMMTTPYSLTIVSASDAGQIDRIRQDFSDDIEWNKWVCVSADHALVAQKDNMVLFLLGSDALYTGTASAIEAADWTNIETFSSNISAG